jgi:S1-C subfamily serine protease
MEFQRTPFDMNIRLGIPKLTVLMACSVMSVSADDRIFEYRSVDPESNAIFEVERENGGQGMRYIYLTEIRSNPKKLVRQTFGNVFSVFLSADSEFLIANEGTGSAGIYPAVLKRSGDLWIEHVTPADLLSQLEPIIKAAYEEFKNDALYRVYTQIRSLKGNMGYLRVTGEFERQGLNGANKLIRFGELTFVLDLRSKNLSKVDPGVVPKSMFRGLYSINAGYGSGFAISKDVVLTNNHVVKKHEEVWVGVGNRETLGRVVCRSEQYDLALIKLDGEIPVVPLQIAAESPKLGQTIMVLGYPLPSIQGYTSKATAGVVSSEFGLRDDPNQFQISAPVQPGNSGGPVISEDGLVLGVVVSSLNKAKIIKEEGVLPENVNLCIHREIIRSFVRSFDESLITQGVKGKNKPILSLSCVQIVVE